MAPSSPSSPPAQPCSAWSRSIACFVGAASLLLSACGPKESGQAPVVATVGGVPLRADAFAEAARHRGGGRLADIDRRALLDELILREAGLQRARELALDRDPAVRRSLEDTLLAALRAKELEPALRAAGDVPEDELRKRYAAAPERFSVPATSRVAWLRQAVPGGADPSEAVKKLEAARAAWSALPADPARRGFGPLATRFSDDQDTRFVGGDLGEISPDDARLPPSARAAAAALVAPGDISPVVVSPDAVCVLLLIAKSPATPLPYERVRARIRAECIAEREAAARAAFNAALLTRPVTRDDARAALVPLLDGPASARATEAGPPAMP